ncbi:hypothetical protein PoB_003682800 [Plakobranchus ocellatus]|uniref:Uncharacterized protein n=1 Tax=Plakobranchus ocellatus TaxID=259542 RepID=A0AAV4AU32_9GAST|nr:hypothetical protein PoB_003682800 [Plakobranchus ocellatus]
MWVVGGSMICELNPEICRGLCVVCSSLARTRTFNKGLEAWDHLVIGRQYATTASKSNLTVSVDHRKHPLTSTSCHPGLLTKEFAGYDKRAWQLWFHACKSCSEGGVSSNI